MSLILSTSRLSVLEFSLEDTQFIIQLLNEEQFKQNIGDRKVTDADSAKRYLQEGPQQSYHANGYGLYKLCLTDSSTPIGMCGFVKREELEFPDLGFALLEKYCRQGYAFEASKFLLKFAQDTLHLKYISAITNPNNKASQKLLEKLGFLQQGKVKLATIERQQLFYSINLNEITGQ